MNVFEKVIVKHCTWRNCQIVWFIQFHVLPTWVPSNKCYQTGYHQHNWFDKAQHYLCRPWFSFRHVCSFFRLTGQTSQRCWRAWHAMFGLWRVLTYAMLCWWQLLLRVKINHFHWWGASEFANTFRWLCQRRNIDAITQTQHVSLSWDNS